MRCKKTKINNSTIKVQDNSGFSLLELVIVMVVLGILFGGIIAGKSMIENTTIQSIVDDVQKYQQVNVLFLTKYNLYPGDFDTGSDYWSGAFDGNADDDVYDVISTPSSTCEHLAAWQHLYKANMLQAEYTGSEASSSTECEPTDSDPNEETPGTTVPTTPLGGNHHYYNFGTMLQYNRLKPGFAEKVDIKMDDGLYNSGLVGINQEYGGSANWDGCCDGSAYDTTQSGDNCLVRIYTYADDASFACPNNP